ncbi:MAG: Kielin/chordin-like protein [Candidatus Woesebacteria bacterium GW2011_GWA2_40_7b]|uniref:Kielin/chordin-like protein n=1 Tax=Candidatus Woesebacteria bacterium GW2011_GWA2_40_7b TaxID=1618563 RepID=A0A0G0VFM2_9BACT|nr:MAG: Kielin/chordin-like protein [Candidatus Woesebacteria bacterium GW2011_GWA2_40_7b]
MDPENQGSISNTPQPVQLPTPEPAPEILPTAAATEQQPITSMDQTPKPKNNFLVPLAVLLVVVSLGSLGFWAYKNYLARPKPLAEEGLPTPTSEVTPDPTANWKTYVNSAYKLSFRYPNELNIETNQVDTANYVQVIFDKSLSNSFTIKASTKYPINQPKFLLDTESTGTKNINGKLWSVFELPNGSLGMQLEENSILYSIIYPVSEGTIVDQILSTFQFIGNEKPVESGISCQYNGRIYKNGESVPSGDKCNTCSCDNGQIACTFMACP